MGSGHVLVYAFDVFMQLYVAEGFRERDAAESILINNLFGLEIDKRSYQLSYFALMMKGREYSRRILTKNVKLHLHQFIDSDDIPNEYFERLEEISSLPSDDFIEKSNLLKLVLDMFLHATEIGSVLNIQNISQSEIDELRQLTSAFEDFSNMDILYQLPEAHEKVNHILNIVEVLSFRYTAVVTNPPYLNKMSAILSKYVKDNYPEVKTDLFSVFIKINSQMLTDGGYAGFMTPFVWMFIKSYEELRNFLIANKNISSLVQMEYSAFEEATVPVCCFTIKNAKSEPIGNYFKLSDFRGGMNVQKEKVLEGIRNPNVNYLYQTNQNNFTKIPGSPISFWVSENLLKTFNFSSISDFFISAGRTKTHGNDFYIRYFWEIDPKKKYWNTFHNGGNFKKYFGNEEEVINTSNLAISHYSDYGGNQKQELINQTGITWNLLTSAVNSFRIKEKNLRNSSVAPTILLKDTVERNVLFSTLGFLNSRVSQIFIQLINPTLATNIKDVMALPIVISNAASSITNLLVVQSKISYDSYEISLDFQKNPLV